MKRRYVYGSKLFFKNGSLTFGTIRTSLKSALLGVKVDGVFMPIIESQKIVKGYWETVKIKEV